jgi:Tol biopolymer transport system component
MRTVLVGAALGALLLAVAAPNAASRSAAFPGRNGEIVFSGLLRANGDYDLYLVRPDGTRLRRLTKGAGFERYPSWSPDGKWFAYISNRTKPRNEGAYEVYVVRPNGTGFRRLTNDRWIDDQVAWSPDGKRLVFGSSRLSGRFGIWTMRAAGGGAARLTRDGALPTWAPDGKAIAFERAPKGYNEIWLMSADGSNQRQLTTPPSMFEVHAQDSMPDWSPGGDEILFTRRYRGRTDIYAVRADGSGLRRLTKQAGLHSWPAWSPDGKRILFVRTLRKRAAIFVMDADGSHQKRVTADGIDYAYPRWQPLR